MKERKYWIDNVRIWCILLLFPFHTAMIFNGFGEPFYILSKPSKVASIFVFSTYPWWMSGLFVLAGISTVYALKKRTVQEYAKERFLRLFIPAVSGIVLLVPIQTYLADRYNYGYTGTYIEHLNYFFRITDFGGYDGHFTPAQLWFIVYLFVISMVSIPFLKLGKKINNVSFPNWLLLPLGILPALLKPLGDIGGKSITEYLTWFLIGYFVLSKGNVLAWVKKHWKIWALIEGGLFLLRAWCYLEGGSSDYFWDYSEVIYQIMGILTMLALGMMLLDKERRYTSYMAKAAFPIYVYHQSYIVIVGYLVCGKEILPIAEYGITMIGAFLCTMVTYMITRRFAITRFLFGIKK